ncbi:MAG: hypothetical protein NZM26_05185 [Patescibacteria group bacterium]|nr:hypothetical protein [Patescibacteria group bacterium]
MSEYISFYFDPENTVKAIQFGFLLPEDPYDDQELESQTGVIVQVRSEDIMDFIEQARSLGLTFIQLSNPQDN